MNNKVCESEVGSVGAVSCPKGIATKRCTNCGIEKTISEYNKNGKKKNGDFLYKSKCKDCKKQYDTQYHKENRQKRNEQNKQYRIKNKDRISERKKDYNKQYRIKNKKHLNEQKKQYLKNKRATDLEYKLKDNIRGRINSSIRKQLNKGAVKCARTRQLLGIPMDKYIRWIEFQFKDGWTWEDKGTIFHIDHVYPIAAHDLSKKEEQFKAFNWRNTRPMCKKENASKGAKIIQSEVFQQKVIVLAFLFHERDNRTNNYRT